MNGEKVSSSKFPQKETWLNVETGEELHFCQSLVNFCVILLRRLSTAVDSKMGKRTSRFSAWMLMCRADFYTVKYNGAVP